MRTVGSYEAHLFTFLMAQRYFSSNLFYNVSLLLLLIFNIKLLYCIREAGMFEEHEFYCKSTHRRERKRDNPLVSVMIHVCVDKSSEASRCV